ncbi:hypothetical protein TNIN_435161 [Trichonephila inaurata madagascariensis]|uniref:Uncharacterized protein n=1 Tax=Trichonephila inaurata madagascariensis TaxID=2747483 RepID=A0A8X7BQX2_9ARAC|nr:hypothetical protein TNIN_435161 [Trichonephila inaurata madagascariensis]
MDEIVELAKQTGLDEVNVEHIEEIVQETAANLSNDELKELTEQEENKILVEHLEKAIENVQTMKKGETNKTVQEKEPVSKNMNGIIVDSGLNQHDEDMRTEEISVPDTLSQLKHSYFNLPDVTDLKDALDILVDLQAQTQELEENVNLRDSRSIASKRLDQLWRRLDRDPKLNNLYTKFLEEYLSLDHMEEIPNIDDITSEERFFLPHHGVLRPGNRSRPLRVVFKG